MAKQKTLSTYVKNLKDRYDRKFGDNASMDVEELIEAAARNKRLLERFDTEIDGSSLTVVSTGSQGQMKEDINPIIKHRNDVAKQYADNLDALMLTPRSRYKKSENGTTKVEDPMVDFLHQIK